MEESMVVTKRAYISGSLTGWDDRTALRKFYEGIADKCREYGIAPYLPHKHTDPMEHPDLTPQRVYQINSHAIESSQIVVAYVGVSSLGVGAEIELANRLNIPIILLYEHGTHVSRHIRGTPNIMAEVEFTDIQDCLEKLGEVLPKAAHK